MSKRVQRELDARLRRIASVARLLPALTARHGRSERLRLVRALESGERMEPQLAAEPQRVPRSVWRDLDEARVLAPQSEAAGPAARGLPQRHAEEGSDPAQRILPSMKGTSNTFSCMIGPWPK